MSHAALVLLNPAARHHTARERWSRVRSALRARFALSVIESDLAGRWRGEVLAAYARGVRVFIAAGGDGTVGALADVLAAGRELPGVWLGAVGLGSSNDFHKPVRGTAAGVPARIDVERAAPRDLGLARWRDERGLAHERVFVVSASVGLVAEANACFNAAADRCLRWLKRRFLAGAILYAAFLAIARHRGLRARLCWPEGAARELELASLSVLKTPHLAGGLRYDTPVAPADGLFAVNLAHRRSRLGLLALLARLARGRFLGAPGIEHRRARSLELASERPFALELDGETFRARAVRFELLEQRVRVCA